MPIKPFPVYVPYVMSLKKLMLIYLLSKALPEKCTGKFELAEGGVFALHITTAYKVRKENSWVLS